MGQIQSAVNQAIGSTGQIVAFGLGPKATAAKQSAAEIAENKKKLETAQADFKKAEAEYSKITKNTPIEAKEPLAKVRMEKAMALFKLDSSVENAMTLAQAQMEHERTIEGMRKRIEKKDKALAEAKAEAKMKNNQIAEMYKNAGLTPPGGSK